MTFSANRVYEEQTQNLLREAKDDLDKLGVRMKEIEKEKELLQKEVQALEMCLSIYLRRTGREPSPTSDWFAILSGYKTHNERIKAIAEHKGGEISVSEVRDILFDSGLMKATKRNSAYIGVYNRIKELEEKGVFQKVSIGRGGRYMLANTQKTLPIMGEQ